MVTRRIERDRSSVAILAYHNIVPHGEPTVGERSVHLPQETFARQLDLLSTWYDFVSLDEALEDFQTDVPRPRVVVTFDDAYTGAVTAGFEELRKRGIPSTMFVPPGLLGGEGFWWDMVTRRGSETLEADIRTHALEALEGRQPEILRWARAENMTIRDLPPHARPVDAAGLIDAARDSNVNLAAHTWSHPNLSRIQTDEAVTEVRRSIEWIRGRGGGPQTWFAYPYGLTSQPVAEEVAACTSGGLLVSGGPARQRGRRRGSRSSVPRVLIARGLTLDGLLLRVAGLVRS